MDALRCSTEDGTLKDIERIRNIENSIKKAPSVSDLKETVHMLRDFGIKIEEEDIPEFATVAELHRWRLSKI